MAAVLDTPGLLGHEARALDWSRSLPLLGDRQLGHLRHIENLASLPDGDWSLMGAVDPGQEWLDAYRYQLAKMAYALGLAHYHRLPAAPAAFRKTYQSLMRKMLRREVWGYWKETSQSGPFLDPGMTQLRDPWTDPIVKENIMYSGHLHAMAGMYAVLFDDDRYAQPAALTLRHQPIFYGMGPQQFEYDFRKVNDTIYWQMVENGWLGVACEPNCIFLICNQFPMLGFRFHDVRHGTTIAQEATESYRRAWEAKGMLQADGEHFHYFWRQRQDAFVDNGRASADTWLGAVLNAWNPGLVQSLADRQAATWFRRHGDGTVSLYTPGVVKARRDASAAGQPMPPEDDTAYNFNAPEFGYAAIWASELGRTDLLEGLLAHADAHMRPTWKDGGLYYPRNDASWSADGRLTYMDPLTGNALLAYARLNVPDGLRMLYENPWRADHFTQPALTDKPDAVDVLRARVADDGKALALVLRPRDALDAARMELTNVPAGAGWSLLLDGVRVAGQGMSAPSDIRVSQQGGALAVTMPLAAGSEPELVLCWE
jgi:hypothetical protein